MVKYNTEISKDTILYLRTLDSELADAFRALVNKEAFKHIVVKYDIEVNASLFEQEPFHVSSNASEKITGSTQIANDVQDFLAAKKAELSNFLDKGEHIAVNIHFESRQTNSEPKNNDYGQSHKDELPYYAPTKPRYNFDQIILPDSIRQQIKEAINIINYQDLIYNVWGFSEVDSIPKSILNFYGKPGTGKTMCAHAIANELGKKLLALNYSEIESKYVGDAPKNLQRAFEIATQEDCVLFFDEADSFLGKRIQNVSQGADQALNSLRSQMLIMLEEHAGVVIFATNLVANFDKAFESRILRHIKFELPNEEARIAIIKKMIPSKLPMPEPLNEEQLKELSKITDGFSGRELKNAILDTLLAKATKDQAGAVFEFDDFKNSFEAKKKEMDTLEKEMEGDKISKIKKAFAEGRIEYAKDKNVQDSPNKRKGRKRDKRRNKRGYSADNEATNEVNSTNSAEPQSKKEASTANAADKEESEKTS